MDDEKKTCPKCKGLMYPGVLLDRGGIISSPQEWTDGQDSFLGVGSIRIKIRSYRCMECGYLENYAV